MNKKLFIFSTFTLIFCSNIWADTKANQAPIKVEVPNPIIDSNGVSNKNLADFKNYLQKQIANDKNLLPQERETYSSYINQLDQTGNTDSEGANDIQQLEQLSKEYRIKTLQSQILEQEKKIAEAKNSIAKDQAPVLAQITATNSNINAASNATDYQPDSIEMIYANNNNIMQASLILNNNHYNDIKAGDNIADNTYQVISIQPTYVQLLNLKNQKIRIINLNNDI